jgi:hypothetical protein
VIKTKNITRHSFLRKSAVFALLAIVNSQLECFQTKKVKKPDMDIDYWTHERHGIPSSFRGNKCIKEESYATELFRQKAVRLIRKNKVARIGNWKWVESPKGGGLFDLSNDIGEKNDLSNEKPNVFNDI